MKFSHDELCNPDVQVYAIVRELIRAGKTSACAHEFALQCLAIPPRPKQEIRKTCGHLKLVVDNGPCSCED